VNASINELFVAIMQILNVFNWAHCTVDGHVVVHVLQNCNKFILSRKIFCMRAFVFKYEVFGEYTDSICHSVYCFGTQRMKVAKDACDLYAKLLVRFYQSVLLCNVSFSGLMFFHVCCPFLRVVAVW